MFSYNNEYVFEKIPGNLNFFSKKVWLNKKIKSFNDDKVLFWSKGNFVFWVPLEEEEKNWIHLERAAFFCDVFKKKNGCLIVCFKENGSDFFYGIVDSVLVNFSNNFDEVKDFLEFNFSNKIDIFAFDSDFHLANKFFSSSSIALKIGYEGDFIKEDGHYLNESDSDYLGDSGRKFELDSMLFHWFDKLSLENKKDKILKIIFFSVTFAFLLLGFYYYFKNAEIVNILDENEITISKFKS
jgi:hypothetical protein